jgi:formylglycine-generating enzyme required for sulfatase activity
MGTATPTFRRRGRPAARASRPARLVAAGLAACCAARSAAGEPSPADGAGRPAETVTIAGTALTFQMVEVPGGRLRVAGPGGGGAREIDVKPFAIAARETTWDLYAHYFEGWRQAKVDGITRPSQPDVYNPREPFANGAHQTDKHPALAVGWFGATAYCEWLSHKTGRQYRLPTEAEWELACRAGSAGEAPEAPGDVAWLKETGGDHTHPVGAKKPNAWGLYDLLGNVWEHVLEPYAPPDSAFALRGGGWNTPAAELRYATRLKEQRAAWLRTDPKRPHRAWWITDAPFIGFRVARLPDDGVGKAEREACAAKLEIRNLKLVDRGKSPYFLARVKGEIAYVGDRPLDEVEVLVHYLDEAGKPLLKSPMEKPCYNKCFPALANSYHPGPHAKPFAPNETRTFELEVPHPFDEVGPLELDKVGAKVTRVHFAK